MTRPTRCGPGRAGHDRHAGRHDHAAAEALQHAEGDQRAGRPGHARQRRAGQEQDDRDHVEALGAEPVGGPAGERDHRREREHVAGRDPLDRRQRRCGSRSRGASIATLTIVVSRIDMTAPSTTTAAIAITPPSRPAAPGRRAADSLMASPRRRAEDRARARARAPARSPSDSVSAKRQHRVALRGGDAPRGLAAGRRQREPLDAAVAGVGPAVDVALGGQRRRARGRSAAGERPSSGGELGERELVVGGLEQAAARAAARTTARSPRRRRTRRRAARASTRRMKRVSSPVICSAETEVVCTHANVAPTQR